VQRDVFKIKFLPAIHSHAGAWEKKMLRVYFKKGGGGILPLASRNWKPQPHFLNIQAWEREKT